MMAMWVFIHRSAQHHPSFQRYCCGGEQDAMYEIVAIPTSTRAWLCCCCLLILLIRRPSSRFIPLISRLFFALAWSLFTIQNEHSGTRRLSELTILIKSIDILVHIHEHLEAIYPNSNILFLHKDVEKSFFSGFEFWIYILWSEKFSIYKLLASWSHAFNDGTSFSRSRAFHCRIIRACSDIDSHNFHYSAHIIHERYSSLDHDVFRSVTVKVHKLRP